jgi:hypothetical protein
MLLLNAEFCLYFLIYYFILILNGEGKFNESKN